MCGVRTVDDAVARWVVVLLMSMMHLVLALYQAPS